MFVLLLAAGAFRVSAQSLLVVPFTGEKTDWHGFDRYDFIMDTETLVITPYKAPDGEGFEIKDPPAGKRRCIIVVPKNAAPSNPWSWRGVYWNHQPQTEVELLSRGFHIAYISSNATLKPGKEWDAWYTFLTEKHNLAKKPNFIGMSRGGEYLYIWATTHPDKVSCIYADNPGSNNDVLLNVGRLALNDVPILHVCGSIDPVFGKYGSAIEEIYHQFGGRISVMIKDGYAHHPHSLVHPKLIADFIEQSFKEVKNPPPAFAGDLTRLVKSSYYSLANTYKYNADEKMYFTTRGPYFVPCYDKYEVFLPGVEAFSTIIAPKHPAPGNPWVFRPEFVDRDAVVDQALLAKGYYIVTGAVTYGDGVMLSHWNIIYKYLTDKGFSKKPVMEGYGGGTGTAYGWAIENPDKVSCIYGQNPILDSKLLGEDKKWMNKAPMDNLAVLAKAGIPIMHVCGSLDPNLAPQTRSAELKYKKLGGKMLVIVKPGEGHYFKLRDTKPVVDFITGNTK